MPHRLPRFATHAAAAEDFPGWLCHAAFTGMLLAMNLAIALQVAHARPTDFRAVFYTLQALHLHDLTVWVLMNAAALSSCLLVRWRYARPLAQLRQMMHQTSGFLDPPHPLVPMQGVGALLKQMSTLSLLVKEYSSARQQVARELESLRQVLVHCDLQQQAMLRTTNREIATQYQSVLSYAHALDEQIQRRAMDPQLRYDLDDLCESSFTLRLIGGALELLRQQETPRMSRVPLADLMQRTMLALVPSLDRRAMKLTTAEMDASVCATTDAGMINQVVWMMLLGLIRYAADESTLRMRCLYDRDRRRALLSIVVSELSPGAMTGEERVAHLLRQMQQGSPHMFAETIRIHGNIQLAELLLQRLGGSIGVVPLSPYACEICLELPAG